MRQRNRVHYKAKLKNHDYHWDKYRHLRNEVISMVRKSKQAYKEKITSQVLDKTIPLGKWWRIVKSITKFSKKQTKSPPIKSNGRIFIHPIDKANTCILNNYFATISGVDDSSEPLLPSQGPGPPFSINIFCITDQDEEDQLRNINPS